MSRSACNESITVKAITREPGPLGVQTETVDSEVTLWGSVEELSAKSRLEYQQQNVNVTHRVKFRDAPALSFADSELEWNGLTLRPVGPPSRQHPRSGWTVIDCEDITNGA